MPVFPQNIVLSLHHTCQGAHQDATLAGEVAIDFLCKSGFEQVTGPDCDAKRQSPLQGSSGGVLLYGVTGVNARAVQEVGAHTAARAFGCDQGYVYVWRRHDTRLVVVGDGEAV